MEFQLTERHLLFIILGFALAIYFVVKQHESYLRSIAGGVHALNCPECTVARMEETEKRRNKRDT